MPLSTDPETEALTTRILRPFPAVRAALEAAGCSVRRLASGERYIDASGELSRLKVDVNAWPVPPAGLFVVPERTLYLREFSAGVLAHELGHAFDCALGQGMYLSGYDRAIREAFANARQFVSPYAATGIDEYVAEGFRAMLGEQIPAFPYANQAILRHKDPALFAILADKMGVLSKKDAA